MDVWAEQYFGRATFICVGCDGPGLATAFAKQLQLKKCLLTYCDSRNGPKWGQLGCNGFIILDASGGVACRATSPFLEVRQDAFLHVESLLEGLLRQTPAPTLASKGGEAEGKVEPFDRVTGGCSDPKASGRGGGGGGGCADGGCAEDDMPKRMKRALAKEGKESGSAAASPRKAEVASLAAIHSVHVDALDAEHEECAVALAALKECPNHEAIKRVLDVYSAHFAHEEEMLDTHLYAEAAGAAAGSGGGTAGGGGFSAAASMRRSHYSDHQRMLGDLRARAAMLPAGGPASGPKAWIHAVGGGEGAAAFVDRVLRAFENHANVYDATYAEPLSAKLREAEAVPAN